MLHRGALVRAGVLGGRAFADAGEVRARFDQMRVGRSRAGALVVGAQPGVQLGDATRMSKAVELLTVRLREAAIA